jgi:HD superfamily phosphohydrolase
MSELSDPLYGAFEINEPVLLDVLHAAAVQRLRLVLQHGITGLIGVTNPTTRFDHSVGVMLLIRKVGNGCVPAQSLLKEQIAALLHDVSHTAFSHVIDYVFGDHDSQEYHEAQKEAVLARSDLPQVLSQHGYAWRDFLDEQGFPLLEQPSPALCADRLDYFLRDARDLGLATTADVHAAIASLAVHTGRLVTTDLEAARWMATTFIAADDASWANFREVGLYELAARAIRRGLEGGALVEADLWGGDAAAWAKLQASPDPAIQAYVRLVSPATGFEWDADRPTFTVSTKLRTIDPPVLVDGAVQPLSALDPAFAQFRAEYLRRKSGKWPVRVVEYSHSI